MKKVKKEQESHQQVGDVLVVFRIYVGFMLDEKLANIEVASFGSKCQRGSVPGRHRESE